MGRKVDIHANVDVYHVADVLIVLKMISEVISENDNSWKEQFSMLSTHILATRSLEI